MPYRIGARPDDPVRSGFRRKRPIPVTFSLSNPHLRLFVGAGLISFSPVFVELVEVSPTTSAFYRVFIGGAALALFLLVTGRRIGFPGSAWRYVALAGAFYAADLWFWHRSINYIGPGLGTLLANLQVFFMMAGGMLLLNQRPGRLQWLSVPLAIVGLTMIVGVDWQSLAPGYRAGVVLGVLTAVSYAGYLLSMRRTLVDTKNAVPIREVAIMSLTAAGLLAVSAFVEGESLAITTKADLTWLLCYGLLAHAVGLIFIVSSLTQVTATEAGIALLLQPSLSFVWDILIFGRAFSGLEVMGATITLAAIYLGSRSTSKDPKGAADEA